VYIYINKYIPTRARDDDDPNSANEYIHIHRTTPAIYIRRRITAEGDVRIDMMMMRECIASEGEGVRDSFSGVR